MSEMKKEILREGDGSSPTQGAQVTVHCTGYGKGGNMKEKFWSTQDPGQKPFTFSIGLGQVIKGWDEGVMTMKVGETARLTCPASYAYGNTGFPAWGILPNSPLIFEIELLSLS